MSTIYYRKSQAQEEKEIVSSTSSSISTAEIQAIVERLRYQKVRNTTKKNYYLVWKTFNDFFLLLDVKPENWEERLTLFMHTVHKFCKICSNPKYRTKLNLLKKCNFLTYCRYFKNKLFFKKITLHISL